jgi:hypothetical protein
MLKERPFVPFDRKIMTFFLGAAGNGLFASGFLLLRRRGAGYPWLSACNLIPTSLIIGGRPRGIMRSVNK